MKSQLLRLLFRARSSVMCVTKPLILFLSVALVVGVLPSQLLPSASAESVEPSTAGASPAATSVSEPPAQTTSTPSPADSSPSSAASPAQSDPTTQAPAVTLAPSSPAPAAKPIGEPFDLSSLASLPPLPRNQLVKDRNPVVDPAEAEARWDRLGPEIVSERTLNAKIYRVDAESKAAFVYGEPIHYADKQGHLKEIDNTIVRSGDGFANAAGAAEINFASQAAANPLVKISSGEHQISFSLRGAAPATAVIDANTIRYSGVRPGVDLIYQPDNHGLKELLVLNDPAAASNPAPFTFALDPGELKPVATKNRGISLMDAEGKERFVIPPASAWDSQQGGDPQAAFGPATFHLRQEGEQWLIDLSIDPAWAGSPERKFPLYLDPEIYISQYGQGGYTPTGMDSYVDQNSSGSNYPAQNYTVGSTTYKVNFLGFSDAYRTFTWFDVNNYHDKRSISPSGGLTSPTRRPAPPTTGSSR